MKASVCLLTFQLILFSSVLNSCKKDTDPVKCTDSSNPDCENYNPCLNSKKTSAYFIMEELVSADEQSGSMPSGHFLRYQTDTVITYKDVVLTCKQKTDSIWWIFDDVEMRPEWQQKQSFSIKFGKSGPQKLPERVKITCIVKNNKINTGCNPNDNGIDTFTRYIVYMPPLNVGFKGTYRGSLQSKPDSIFTLTLKIDTIKIPGSGSNDRFAVRFDELLAAPPYEVPGNNDIIPGTEYGPYPIYGYYGFYLLFNAYGGSGIDPSYKGKTVKGFAIYNPVNNQIIIEYIRHANGKYYTSEWPPKDIPLSIFTGTRIN